MAGENHINVGSEVFYTASGAAAYLNIKRGMFYTSVCSKVQSYRLEPRKRRFYKQSDLEPFRRIYAVAS